MDITTLDSSSAAVLSAIQLRAAVPLSEVAKDCGQREHVVRYTVNKFLDAGIIRKRPIINLSALGYTEFVIYLSISHTSQESKQAFEKQLQTSERIGDILELGGEYRYGFVYCCKDVVEASDFVTKLTEKTDAYIFERVIGIRVASTVYRRKYLSKKTWAGVHKITNVRNNTRIEIDELDRKIIASLHHQHSSYRELSRKLEISHSTFALRLKRLYKNKVILGEVYGVEAQKFGMLCYRLLIVLRRSSENLRKVILEFSGSNESVVVCNEVFGSWNYELLVEVKTTRDITDVVQSLYEVLGDHLATVKTLPLFQFLKVADYPFKR